jgi:hypothetical protein
MNLTDQQKTKLSQMVYESFTSFYDEELNFQVESLKDTDELSWDYNVTPKDSKEIYDKVQQLILALNPVTVE